jgi:glutamate-ammonia-ligase adenylyltransferase
LATAPRLADRDRTAAACARCAARAGLLRRAAGAHAELARAAERDAWRGRSCYEEVLDRARIFGQEQAFLIGVRVLAGTVSAEAAGQAFARLAEQLIVALHRTVTEASSIAAYGRIPGMRDGGRSPWASSAAAR